MKYFYRDPLKAAWMAREFMIKFESPDNIYGEVLKKPIDITTEIIRGKSGIGDSPDYFRINFGGWQLPDKHYIHSDYYEILIPQIGDLVLFGNGNVNHWIYDSEYYIDPKNGIKIKYNWQEIIQRNDKAFFMPESEV